MSKDQAPDESNPLGRGVPQAGVRIANERAVLTLVAVAPGSSNADLARRSGLGPQTTSRIIADLEERGLIMRGQVLRGRRGQPATPLFINPQGAYAIGVEIGWRHLQIVLLDFSGSMLASERRHYEYPDATRIFAELTASIASMTAALTPLQRQRIVGVGVATPTTIGRNQALQTTDPSQEALWRSIDIATRVASDTGLFADWFNDGSAACWAEILAHPAPRPQGFAYFQVGTYIGAGIVADRRLWEGPTGNAANLGAIMVTDRNRDPTYVYLVASIVALERWLHAAGVPVPQGSPQDWDWTVLEPYADLWIDDAGRALASALITTQAIVELEQVTIDGVMPRPIVERLLERAQHHLSLLPKVSAARPAVTIGRLGASAGAIGAAQLLVYKRHFSRTWSHFGT